MSFTIIDWLIFFLVPLIALAIGIRKRDTKTWRGFFLAQSSLPWISVASTYFGANLTFTAIFLILSEESYRRGFWVLSVPISWLIGTLVFIRLYPRIKPYIERGTTLHQAIGEAFKSKSLQRLVSVWTITAFTGTVALEFYGGIKLLQWINLPILTSLSIALLLALIVTGFTVIGGFRGVSYADMFLDVITFGGAFVLLFYLFKFFGVSLLLSSPPITAITESHSSIVPVPGIVDNLSFVFGMIIIFIPFQICALDSWQRLSAWNKTDKSLNKVLLYPTILLILIYCIPILVGVVIRNQGISVPLDSHPLKLFLEGIAIPPILLGLVVTGFISAIFTTADELLNCSSLSLLFDTFLIPRQADRTAHEEKKIVLGGKIYTCIFAFLAALIALLALEYERKISELALAVFSTQVIFTFPLYIALFRKDKAPSLAKTATIAMLLSFIVAVGAVFSGWVVREKQLSDAAPVLAFFTALATFGIAKVISLIRSKSTKN